MDPEVEFTPYERALEEGGAYEGHAGVRSWWQDAFAVLPKIRSEYHEVRDLGDLAYVRGTLSGRGAGSGAAFERTWWGAIRWRDKKVVWWCAFDSEAEALEAVGLREHG